MILSMTGFGEAQACEDAVSYRAEIRSVNNRYFKASIKLPDHLQRYEMEIEKLLRAKLGRGSISYSLRLKGDNAPTAFEINEAGLQRYVSRLEQIAAGSKSAQIDLASLLELPGICEPIEMDPDLLARQFAVASRLTDEAIARLVEMRRVEGQALEKDLALHCREIRTRVASIAERAPLVVEEYHKKLRQRVSQLMESANLSLDQDALVREVAVFAERCDVNEEISRLLSHLDQFAELCASKEEAGRKLDFLAQEMLREANTIGSKASDSLIARHVVEVKAAIDRIKEQVQNVE